MDQALLRDILSPRNEPELSGYERAAFTRMLDELFEGKMLDNGSVRHLTALSSSQRLWAQDVAARLKPLDATKVLRGKEVATPEVLLKRPLKPPTRIA